jgi:transcriptional regulator with XRE-family HTH domain
MLFRGFRCAHELIPDGSTGEDKLGPQKKPDAVDAEVGNRIRLHRLQSGLSQTALGDELGVTFQQVQKYERGVNRVGAGRLTKIAKVLGVPIAVLLGPNDPEETAETQGHQSPFKLLAVPGALRLLRAYTLLADGRTRQCIVDLVQSLAGDDQKRR